jgi:hypothetical protein
MGGEVPTFLYIGVAKAGSSWMYEILREHPEVFVPPAKDLQFFSAHYEKGFDWYQSFFSGAKGKSAVGELTHDYYLSAKTAHRIRKHLPEVNIICCLREVVDRAVSAYTYNLSTEYRSDLSFEGYMEMPEILLQSAYFERLRPYFELFSRERILVLFHDDMKKDPQGFARRLYGFLDVDPDFQPPSLLERINVAHEARVETLAHLIYKVAGILRKAGLANLVGRVKRNRLFERLLYKPKASPPQISERVLREVYERYRGDYEKLAELIGEPVPADWFNRYA